MTEATCLAKILQGMAEFYSAVGCAPSVLYLSAGMNRSRCPSRFLSLFRACGMARGRCQCGCFTLACQPQWSEPSLVNLSAINSSLPGPTTLCEKMVKNILGRRHPDFKASSFKLQASISGGQFMTIQLQRGTLRRRV
ncbi:hypothetical protein GALMADRAFT_743958 [Galerina marginata CBS 339.88]|uniref:Uncharacterized protein n=1 Tax=Galerina marginata (strain CBS 339.88) TaxID=685588 RepID=A0A067T1W7_GALM3|nr:hypothetical protein GALMADRAFT_743958 [Galerina marginata CBS 339.88]